MRSRKIIHCDCDCFYASVEMRDVGPCRKHVKVTDGVYVARIHGKLSAKRGVIRSQIALVRKHGTWHVWKDFATRGGCGTCGPLTSAKYQRPVFGGKQVYPLRFSYRLKHTASVSVVLYRGAKKVHSYGTHTRHAGHTYRIKRGLKGLKKADYTMVLTLKRGKERVVARMHSRRI